MTCFFIVSLADMTFRNSHRPESDFLLPNRIIRPPSLSLQLKRGCFWNFLLENCHTFFFLLKKIFHIEPLSTVNFLTHASQFFPALNLKKYFIEKKFWKGRANSYFKTEVAATGQAGPFRLAFWASFRAGVKPFAFSQWLTANYVKPLI